MVYFTVFYIFWVTPACVWCCNASTFTERKNHQTSNLIMKYSEEHNKGMSRSQANIRSQQEKITSKSYAPDVNCFITRPKPLKNLPPPYKLRFRTVQYCHVDTSPQQLLQNGSSTHPYCTPQNYRFIGSRQEPCSPWPPPLAQLSLCTELPLLCWLRWRRGEP